MVKYSTEEIKLSKRWALDKFGANDLVFMISVRSANFILRTR